MSGRPLLLLAMSLCLASCASPVPKMMGQLQDKPVCCQSFDQMEFAPLPADKDTSVKLDGASSVFDFPSGKSYFRAFKLPAPVDNTDLQVTSYAGGSSAFDMNVFYPQILLLDEQHHVQRVLAAPGYRYTVEMLRGISWSTRISIRPGESYLVVFTSPAAVDYGLPYPSSSGHGGVIGNTPYYSPGSPAGLVPLAPEGKLTLGWIKRDPPRTTVSASRGPGTLPVLENPAMTVLTGSKDERGLIDWDGFQVVAIDKKRVDFGWTGDFFKMPIPLSPGEHTALVFYRSTYGYANGEMPDAYMQVKGDLKAGRRYRVVGTIDNELATAWIEDAEDGSRASEQVSASIYWQLPLRSMQPAGK